MSSNKFKFKGYKAYNLRIEKNINKTVFVSFQWRNEKIRTRLNVLDVAMNGGNVNHTLNNVNIVDLKNGISLKLRIYS
jgi:hypothetical protein